MHITYLYHREHAFELGEIRIAILTEFVITVIVGLGLVTELSVR